MRISTCQVILLGECNLDKDDSKVEHLAHGLLSLWDMINYYFSGFVLQYETLKDAECKAIKTVSEYDSEHGDNGLGLKIPRQSIYLSQGEKDRIVIKLNALLIECRKLKLDAACNHIDRFSRRLLSAGFNTIHELVHELRILRETIEDEIKNQHFYHYPRDKAEELLQILNNWKNVFEAFPSAKAHIASAVDCYAMDQNTACIFHLMRVIERGLHALAREQEVVLPNDRQLEWEEWGKVIEAVDANVKKTIDSSKRGPVKDTKLGFYRGAIGHFRSFKDVYRNNTMHTRKDYDEFDAIKALEQVRQFMGVLSTRINEDTKEPLDWSF